ncbi:hypothetical protein ASZ90_003919 [hydrocarbon metagenome]|uniref:Colicin v production protein n=1 Tax=hydrocarbon metagenome TaxID=938273 RepID=A0A0W8FZB9_9ZZZZ
MNYVDYTIIFLILIGFILGYKDGFIRKVIGVIGLVVGIVLAFQYSVVVGKFLSPIFDNEENLAEIIAGILIFLLVIFISSVIKRIIHPADKVNKFLNQLLGGFSGAVQMLFFISGFLLLLNLFKYPAEITREESLLFNTVYNVIPTTVDFIIGENSKASDFIRDFIEKKDSINLEEIEIDSTIIRDL